MAAQKKSSPPERETDLAAVLCCIADGRPLHGDDLAALRRVRASVAFERDIDGKGEKLNPYTPDYETKIAKLRATGRRLHP